jgi:hypothetical protein
MAGFRSRLTGPMDREGPPKTHVVVGIAHVAAGAIRVLSFVFFVLTNSGGFAFPLMAIPMLVLAAVTVLAGLWLADGRRRGGILALGTDLLVLLALLVLPGSGGGLDVAINAGLAAAALVVLPGLSTSVKEA